MEAARALVAAKTADDVGPHRFLTPPAGVRAVRPTRAHPSPANNRLSIAASDGRTPILLDDVDTLESDRTSDESMVMKNVRDVRATTSD
jgi:hypothetical protein